ncbi:uncharacterized protein LOC119373548 [Rhipicephalus sanguineus]|uniref:uncharacterized protein LOC119373548 n=1 Tax=Rhipicephalus sanguineus TaxID=34632 RepID=UPI0020C522A3|nr:uncharacterized protein LOC119373548 [Rhipicephalus sanguineus]
MDTGHIVVKTRKELASNIGDKLADHRLFLTARKFLYVASVGVCQLVIEARNYDAPSKCRPLTPPRFLPWNPLTQGSRTRKYDDTAEQHIQASTHHVTCCYPI